MASAVDRDSARRREILEAAKTCFLKYGYGKTSLDDIAQHAKLSRPLLYRKFANKDAIFAALYDDVCTAQLRAAVPVARGKGTKAEKLRRLCELVCVEPYELISQAPMAEEFWTACNLVIPEILADHDRAWRALLAQVLPAALVEVFALAIEGLYSDQPSPAVFRKRLGVLIARFTAR
jgi:AcrR family transcriptional regulator